jgi:hypothetical protein
MINVLVKIPVGGTLEDAMTAFTQAKMHYALNYKAVAKSGVMIVDGGKCYLSQEAHKEATEPVEKMSKK